MSTGLMDALSDRNADQAEVGDAGIQLLLYMYRGNQTLRKLRYVYLPYLTLWMPKSCATKVAEIELSLVFQYING